MLATGTSATLRQEGVTGITANPTGFDKAVTGPTLYDEKISRLAQRKGGKAIAWELLVEDVRDAADVLRPVYEAQAGAEGFVSIEVSPDIAYHTERTIEMAGALWSRCQRPTS